MSRPRWWRRAIARPGARRAVAVLGVLYVAMLLAPFVAPCDPLQARDEESHLAPNVSFVDSAGRARWWPVVRSEEGDAPLALLVREDGTLRLFGRSPGGPMPHLLGTDLRGRDLFARIVHGSRVSLTVGLIGVAVSFVLGMLVGGAAGAVGGRLDAIAMRLCELLMLLPGFYVLLALRGALPDTTSWSSARVYATVVAIVSAIWWAGLARAIRGQVLAIRERDHVLAAKALGASGWRVLVRHLLPETLPFALVAAALAIPGYVLMESGLSMLGLGIQEPEPSWGNLLAEATRVSQVSEHPWMLAPGAFLCAAVAAWNVLGESLRSALDPRAAAR